MNEHIYIFGHKKPDTDSITSAMALSYLKNKLGLKTVPYALGHLNNETKFVLNYFKFREPKFLNDVKLQIKDILIHKNCFVNYKASIYDTYLYMSKYHISGLPIVDDYNKFLGIVTNNDMLKEIIGNTFLELNTTITNINKVINGKIILNYDQEIKGEIIINDPKIDDLIIPSNIVLIAGNDDVCIEYAIKNRIKLLIINDTITLTSDVIEELKKNQTNVISTPLTTMATARLLSLSNYIESLIDQNNKPVVFYDIDYVDDFLEFNSKAKHTFYPILKQDNTCLGLLIPSDLSDRKRKQVILVDHNEIEQSADGIEEADILEIIDHHKLGNVTTSYPINLRMANVGSTNTIIFYMYQDNNVDIPPNIAGLMLSGIISDTLLFCSPTTTKSDREAVEILSKIADIDYNEYAYKMFKEGSSLKGKTKEAILYSDFKRFNVNDQMIGIGQVTTMDALELLNSKNEYIALLNQEVEHSDYDFMCLFIVDISKNGSYALYSTKAEKILSQAFHLEKITEGYFLENVMSRKKQIIPSIIEVLDWS